MTFFAVTEKTSRGSTSVTPFGVVFAPPCWLLIYANRERVTSSEYAAGVVALVGVICGVGMWLTGWSYL